MLYPAGMISDVYCIGRIIRDLISHVTMRLSCDDAGNYCYMVYSLYRLLSQFNMLLTKTTLDLSIEDTYIEGPMNTKWS